MTTITIPHLKRKHDEVADSESEEEDEFGWAGDDDPLAGENLFDDHLDVHNT